jgi:hypothetical protein
MGLIPPFMVEVDCGSPMGLKVCDSYLGNVKLLLGLDRSWPQKKNPWEYDVAQNCEDNGTGLNAPIC